MSDTSGDALTRENWAALGKALREPFDPGDVDFLAKGKPSEQTGKANVVAYIDARAVQDRLDAVVGVGNWSFDWQAQVVEKGEVMVAKGVLTIYGLSKADVGSASNFEQSLGAVSHCFKRAAVMWGIGRYLYSLPQFWVAVERGGRIPEAVIRDLRAKLPRTPSAPAPRAEVVHEATATDREGDAQTEAEAGMQPWTTYLNDMAFRNRAKKLGYMTVRQVEELVTAACGAGQPVTKAKVRDHLVALEEQAVRAANLQQAFNDGRPS